MLFVVVNGCVCLFDVYMCVVFVTCCAMLYVFFCFFWLCVCLCVMCECFVFVCVVFVCFVCVFWNCVFCVFHCVMLHANFV